VSEPTFIIVFFNCVRTNFCNWYIMVL